MPDSEHRNGQVVALWCDECRAPIAGCRATDCDLRAIPYHPDEQHREFVEGLTRALQEKGVPAMPSWQDAIDYLARMCPKCAGTVGPGGCIHCRGTVR